MVSCSKCHQPHNSGLPRLMQTNCLNFNHRGNRVSGGQAMEINIPQGGEFRGYPEGNVMGNSASSPATTSCHAGAGNNTGTWPTNNLWNTVTPW